MDIQDYGRLYCDGQERVEATAYHGQCRHGTEDDRQDDKGQIPKSSIDYIIRKAATSTIFYLPQEVAKSPLEHKIDSEAEKRYKPSVWEKNAGIALGSVTDLACMGGLGGGLKTAATWIGSDMLVTHVGDKLNDRSDVPMIIAPGKEDEYRRTQQEKKKQAEQNRRTSHNLRKHSRQHHQKK